MGGKSQTEYTAILCDLRALVRPDKAAFLPGFFRAVPGGYGEGDVFLGVVVPDIRKVARRHRTASSSTLAQLLEDERHELRLCALLIAVDQFGHGTDEGREQLIELYITKLDRVNNWDLVDLSAPKLLGAWLLHRDRSLLDDLLASEHLWRQRVAVLATLAFIREGDFADTLRIADRLLHHEHDLIHKAVGWMLREIGNRDVQELERFLKRQYPKMPRTMLRYAIEKLPETTRQDYLTGRA
ncbi:MAG: DNA alkylation repair protein [Myxococcales bacterium]|nr:DNA alkylation repair protein [Myxococcales bacterium]